MAKPKQSKSQNLLYVLLGSVILLVILCLVLACVTIRSNKTDTKSPSISLGSMQYDFSSGKAVKRNDTSVQGLYEFLAADAAHEGCSEQAPAYEHVVAYTKDETQVFIKYGCGAADSPMYAVKLNGVWKMLSPTNHFDNFNIPDCIYLTNNSISKEIAPVCANGIATGSPTYSVR